VVGPLSAMAPLLARLCCHWQARGGAAGGPGVADACNPPSATQVCDSPTLGPIGGGGRLIAACCCWLVRVLPVGTGLQPGPGPVGWHKRCLEPPRLVAPAAVALRRRGSAGGAWRLPQQLMGGGVPRCGGLCSPGRLAWGVAWVTCSSNGLARGWVARAAGADGSFAATGRSRVGALRLVGRTIEWWYGRWLGTTAAWSRRVWWLRRRLPCWRTCGPAMGAWRLPDAHERAG
jgi:hypothetical protein